MTNRKTPLAEASIACFDCGSTFRGKDLKDAMVRALSRGWGMEQRKDGRVVKWLWICRDHRRPKRS